MQRHITLIMGKMNTTVSDGKSQFKPDIFKRIRTETDDKKLANDLQKIYNFQRICKQSTNNLHNFQYITTPPPRAHSLTVGMSMISLRIHPAAAFIAS